MQTHLRAVPRSTVDESNITNFIPSFELRGSRAEKVATLDVVMDELRRIRRTLVDEPTPAAIEHHAASAATAPVWPWFVAGMAIGAFFAIWGMLAWLAA